MTPENQPFKGRDLVADISPKSLKIYQRHYERAYEQAESELRITDDTPVALSPEDVAAYVMRNPRNLQRTTLVLQRAALLYFFRDRKPHGHEAAIELLTAWRPTDPGTEDDGDDPDEQRAATRSKGKVIPEGDLHLLSNHLMGMGEAGARAQYMLLSTVACGARPVEWLYAQWVGTTTLRLYTAKAKRHNALAKIPAGTFPDLEAGPESETAQLFRPRGGAGGVRAPSIQEADFERRLSELNLDPQEDADLIQELRDSRDQNSTRLFRDIAIAPEHCLHIDLLLRSIRRVMSERLGEDYLVSHDRPELEETFKVEFYNPLRHAIWRACKNVFAPGVRYSMADARSTFSANRRATVGIRQASADLGHSHLSTTVGHYPSGKAAWPRLRVAGLQKRLQQGMGPQKDSPEQAADVDSSAGEPLPPNETGGTFAR